MISTTLFNIIRNSESNPTGSLSGYSFAYDKPKEWGSEIKEF